LARHGRFDRRVQTPGEINMADNAANPAAVGSFALKSEAEAFLARALPAATAANPK
jgi:hypothetical protein